jgi:peptide chain release factor 1
MAEINKNLLDKLEELDERYRQLEEQISDPSISSDSAKLISISKEQGKLKGTITKYREYKKIGGDIADAKKIVEQTPRRL